DWTFEDPHAILANLKKGEGYYNFQKRTVGDFWDDVGENGLWDTVADRLAWKRMRMEATDISDVTGATYTFLTNGQSPGANWTGLFHPGERVRLRFVNASAATIFDVRLPGLEMDVVQVSGQHVERVRTEEFRIGVAERYDVVVEPGSEDRAYTVFAEAIDRSGYARGTLAPREGMQAPIPEARKRPVLTMADMGMVHDGMEGMDGMDHGGGDSREMNGAEHGGMDHDGMGHDGMGHEGMDDDEMSGGSLRPPGTLPEPVTHDPDRGHGPGHAGLPMMTRSRLHEPGIGLGNDGRNVLTYTDLRALDSKPEFRAPDREIELHLTGNMERFMWGIDGVEFSEAEPILTEYGERIRLTIVNDTMMNHPMHLHGMFMELENGHGERCPLIDTIL
ncbi:MAG: multicopper oxidase domain-containing protein, partial [Rhodothermales bacterium]